MTPDQLAKSGLEHGEQVALFQWCAFAVNGKDAQTGNVIRPLPLLRLLFAIPNGGARGDGTKLGAQISGGRLLAEGVKPGTPDLFLPVARRHGIFCHGLFIEMKRKGRHHYKNGDCSDEQIVKHKELREQGYCVEVCYGWEEARDMLLSYLAG